MGHKNLLTVNKLKKYLNSREFDEESIVTLFDLNECVRFDIFEDAISDEWLEDELMLDIDVSL